MNGKWRQGMWLCFWTGNVATWVACRTLWMVDHYELILATLSVVTSAVAVVVAIRSRFEKYAMALLGCGLLLGQWWLVQKILMRVYWTIGGFAP